MADPSPHPTTSPPPAPAAAQAPAPTPAVLVASQPAKRPLERVILRPWPKVIFLYPTAFMAAICWLASFVTTQPEAGNPTLGWLFMLVFGLNLMVFAFEFSRIKTITIFVVIVAIVLGLGWANHSWGVLPFLRNMFQSIDIRMNTQTYGFVACIFLFIYAVLMINSRFNYYEVNRNEILHHHGYLGDIKRVPTSGLRMEKEIYDLLEFALLRSGRLIFYPSTVREALVIDNVVNVNKVEKQLAELLSSMSVVLSDGESDNQ
jgi:hypothetical protein